MIWRDSSGAASVLERLEAQPDIAVLDTEYTRLLGYPPHRVLEGRSLEIANMTRAWFAEHGRPWYYMRAVRRLDFGGAEFEIDGITFTSPFLQRQFAEAEAHTAVIVAVSAGEECVARSRELWLEGKPDEYFFMEMFGGAIVEHLITQAGAQLCAWADPQEMAVLPHYSPGYPEWEVSEQNALLDLICAGADAKFPSELTALESGMLKPKKSLLAVFGLTRQIDRVRNVTTLVPCESCSLTGCDYRRKPYFLDTIREMKEIDEFSANGRQVEICAPAIRLDAEYSISKKALRKWADSRLELYEQSDGSIQAVFRYDGTTCSNMGYPLQYLYTISLSGPESRYRILDARCEPVEGDKGYTKQCEYLKNAKSLTSAIAREKPLLGQPLDDVLDWTAPSIPSGCYCDESSRNHKWTIAYEALHFGLARYISQKNEDLQRTGTE